MTLFQQRTMIDGSMPYTHIAEVQAVSFTGPEMRVRLISVSPPVELPIYFLPDGGISGDPLTSRETVEAYYHPAVPRQSLPPEQDPQILTEYVSARYYHPGEKVIVMQDGQDFFVMSHIFPSEYTVKKGIEAEIEHEEWLTMMNGAVLTPRTFFNESGILLEDGTLYTIPKTKVPFTMMSYQNYNLAYSMTWNARFPIYVFPREPLVHLSNVPWSWAGGAYNYAYFDKKDDSFYQKSGGEYERFWSPSVVFPGRAPDVRLEIQSATTPGTDWLDELPDIQFYATSSGMNFDTSTKDFVNNDDHVELILTIQRPWGTIASNPNGWETSNWVPPIMFCPNDSLSDPASPTALPKPAISFGWVDYKKNEYTGDRFKIGNTYRFVTGKIYAELKTESIGKPLLGKNDYDYTETHTVEVKDSRYEVYIEDTAESGGGSTNYTRTVTMNQPGESEKVFTVCTDGTNILKKKPILSYIDSRTTGNPIIESVSLSLSVEHYINDTLMFTSTFNVDSDVWRERLYYLYSIDLVNKIILAHAYVYDDQNTIQKVEGVVIDNGTEYVVWVFDKSSNFDTVTEPVNFPPWLASDNFPDHHFGDDQTNFPVQYTHLDIVWKTPYFDLLSFPLNSDTQSDCAESGELPGNIGTYFPCTPYDEDIRSVLLMNTIHYDDSPSVLGYTQQKQHNIVRPRRTGWVAFMRCCFSPLDGTISYTYGSDIVLKENGSVSDGAYLLGTPDQELSIYEV